MSRDSRYLEDLLHHDIPLTRALGLQVEQWENHELRVKVPLQANINHKSSMFGGSLYCASVLAGWGWLHLRLAESGLAGAVVIRNAQISYLLPVEGDALSRCSAPAAEDWQRFVTLFQRRGVARLTLNSEVLDAEGRVAVQFSGEYVLQR